MNPLPTLIHCEVRHKVRSSLSRCFGACIMVHSLTEEELVARLFSCGFEENNLTATMWSATVGSPTIVTTPVHSGTYAMRALPNAAVDHFVHRNIIPVAGEGMTHYHRFYVRWAAFPTTAAFRIFFQTGNTGGGTAMSLQVEDSGPNFRLRMRAQIPATSADSAINLALNTWYRMEVTHVISDTTGSLELKWFTGDSIIEEETLTLNGGIDTLPSTIGQFRYGHNDDANVDLFIDDIAVNDDAGPAPFNALPGPGNNALQKTVSDNSVTWERSVGSVNSDNVDDLPGAPDDASGYNQEAVTLNSVDRLNAGTLSAEVPADAQIISVDVYGRVGSDQALAANMRLKLWDEGGSLTDGPTVATDLNGWRIIDTDEHLVFDSSGKTKANVESFDYGYENITDDATRERRITALWANVEWLEGAADGPDTEFLPDQFGGPQPTIIKREVTPY